MGPMVPTMGFDGFWVCRAPVAGLRCQQPYGVRNPTEAWEVRSQQPPQGMADPWTSKVPKTFQDREYRGAFWGHTAYTLCFGTLGLFFGHFGGPGRPKSLNCQPPSLKAPPDVPSTQDENGLQPQTNGPFLWCPEYPTVKNNDLQPQLKGIMRYSVGHCFGYLGGPG